MTTQTRLSIIETRAIQTSSRLRAVEASVATLNRGAKDTPRVISGRVQRPGTVLAAAAAAGETPGPELSTYYPTWIDWPGKWINGTNTAYASFEANIMALFAANLNASGMPSISRVYIAFMAPNPLLASVVVDFDSTGKPVTGINALYIPPGGTAADPLPATSMPCAAGSDFWIFKVRDAVKAAYPGFVPKFVLSVGGWSYCQIENYFAPFATMTSEQISAWATAATHLACTTWGYDGIDLDYELPTSVPANYAAGSILDKVVNALADNLAAGMSDAISVTVAGAYTEVGGAGLLATLAGGSNVRVINLMVYDSGCLTRYDPAAFALQFNEGYDGTGTSGPPALPAIPGNKLGFGLEIVPQAISATIKPYTMDVCVAQTLAAAAANYGFKEVFLWVCSPPDLSMSTFTTYLQYITAGLTGSGDQTLFTATNVVAATGTGTVFAAATQYTVSAVYDLGPLDVHTSNSWVPGDLPPSA